MLSLLVKGTNPTNMMSINLILQRVLTVEREQVIKFRLIPENRKAASPNK